MVTKARVEQGQVVELLTAEPFPEFHPSLVWVNCSGDVAVGWTYEHGEFAPPKPPTAESIADAYIGALQREMDSTARSRGYDDIKSAITYLQSSIPKFAAEAAALCVWRDAVWRYGLEQIASVQVASKPLPSIEDFVSAMPPIEWPEGV
ncbi:hypothetical protein [Cupriavidus alkaliphilus]|uniref:hypothetical protein n=1 Tax=Cupriavidus alkaliphilus TaxID=942866 RepID=UPI00161CEAF6|nr:hypothetical protein [Cupriavidus alkaliphilus]MBB2918346.1 hypothetical protein [Cupriavidus alkaliphilus]